MLVGMLAAERQGVENGLLNLGELHQFIRSTHFEAGIWSFIRVTVVGCLHAWIKVILWNAFFAVNLRTFVALNWIDSYTDTEHASEGLQDLFMVNCVCRKLVFKQIDLVCHFCV